MRILDMDTHFAAANEFDYVPEEYKHMVPKWLPHGDGTTRLVAPARPEPPRATGTLIPRRRPICESDPEARIQDMDAMGIEKQLLCPQFTEYAYEIEPRLAAAMCKSSNFVVGEVLRTYPDRFIGGAVLPTQNINATLEEAEHAREAGFAAFFMKAAQGGRSFGDVYFWPLYDYANTHNMPIAVHSTSKDLGCAIHLERLGDKWGQSASFLADYVLSVYSLIYDGVFDRFPNLKFCFSEAGASWLIWVWERLSMAYDGGHKSRPITQRHPTEYLAANVFVTVEPSERSLGYVCENLSSKNLMVGTDYPHGDVTGRGGLEHGVTALKEAHIDGLLERKDLTQQVKEDIAFGNALRFLGETT